MIKVIKTKDINEKIKAVTSVICVIATLILLFRYSQDCKKGIIYGLTLCASTLVPSLFLYMILASYVSTSSISDYISILFGGITKKFFKLPKSCSTAIFLSLIGGYPIGAKCIESAYKSGKISEVNAEKCSLITVSSGPGFVLSFIGNSLYHDNKTGIILFVSQILSFFVTSFIISLTIKSETEKEYTLKITNNHSSFFDSIQSGCKSILNMCSMVILFSSLVSLCEKILYKYTYICDAVIMLLEVTTACSKLYTKYPLYMISFCIGFSGLCIHFQIFHILKDVNIKKSLFFLFRIIQGISSACLTYILLIFFPISAQVFSTIENTKPQLSTSAVGGIMVILTSLCFLNSIKISNLKRRY